MLHAAGRPVLLCGRTHRDSITVCREGAEPIVLPGPVHTDPRDVDGPFDVVLFAVKDTQNAAAGAWLARLCDERTVVCALQNGIEQAQRVGALCPSSHLVPAVLWFSSEIDGDGRVLVRTPVRVVLPETAAGRRLARLMRCPGMTLETSADFLSESWRKLLANALAGLMALSGRRSGMFRRDDISELAHGYMAECAAVARADGARLSDADIAKVAGMFAKLPEDLTTSILTDRGRGLPLEWDIRNGVIIRKGIEHRLATPISDVLVPLLAAASDGPG
ncbi:2-dehydropantoate 2-reductase [Mycobacterium paraffinicum]|uniref:2-dehydropantoate 2-reductase n=2 Tax=Mycobacterium paraffinicum TaxID=53378 RepID=A0A1Q4I3B7_9MYCO|nr:2-dehydropantoate 2-reductase [Mycobacterium paraffinicum]